MRANGCGWSVRSLLLAVLTTAMLGGLIELAAVTPAAAQFTYNPRPPRPTPPKVPNDNQMLVQATEV
ncbi:hypothetical protein ABTK06_19385, partial [Acinetobacter baumannii]